MKINNIICALIFTFTYSASSFSSSEPIQNTFAGPVMHNKPVAIDNRIKTFIYSENEIYKMKFCVMYQSIIELSPDETVELIALGNPDPWKKIKTIGKRIFIKPLDPDVTTNMTIITDKRIYLMEISSSYCSEYDEDIIYVARFYYSDPVMDIPLKSTNRGTLSGKLTQVENRSESMASVVNDARYNYSYTFSGGGKDIVPIKVFDDGKKTYFVFKDNNAVVPSIFKVDDGKEEQLDYSISDNYIVINDITEQFSLRLGSELICVFNEKLINK
jgi:type IV secretion system protein VirB9